MTEIFGADGDAEGNDVQIGIQAACRNQETI
jgi:hypothetical protein